MPDFMSLIIPAVYDVFCGAIKKREAFHAIKNVPEFLRGNGAT
jgi:hypothetical protein